MTLKYRHDLSQSQSNNNIHREMLLNLTFHINALQIDQIKLQDYYRNNYQIVLGIVNSELKQLRKKLEHVNNMYSLHSQIYASKAEL